MHKAAFTPENAAMLLIAHQVGTMAWTHSHDINLVKQNALKLARIAKAAGLPTVLTSSMEDRIQGPLVPEFKEILPDEFAARIKRPGIVNAMHHEGFNKAVKRRDARSCSWPASRPRSASPFPSCKCSTKAM